MQPTHPSWGLAYSPKQPVPEYQCHHDDCRRTFVRKTSLTNHLKAHQNVRSRSIYRTKRARLRAAAARAAAEAAASADKLTTDTKSSLVGKTPVIISSTPNSSLPPHPPPHPPPPPPPPPPTQDKPPLEPETSPISSTAPTATTPQPSTTENAEALLNDISLSLVSPLSFTPQEDPLLPPTTWTVEQPLPLQIRANPESEQDPAFPFTPDRTSEELLDPTDPNYDFLHDLYKYH